MNLSSHGWRINLREFGNMEFICKHGVGHYPTWAKQRIHGCDGCCSLLDFPGRAPQAGDIAYCGAGILGMILNPKKQRVTYPDGNTAEAWAGIRLALPDPNIDPQKRGVPGDEWSSRNPIIIGRIEDLDISALNPLHFG